MNRLLSWVIHEAHDFTDCHALHPDEPIANAYCDAVRDVIHGAAISFPTLGKLDREIAVIGDGEPK